MKTFKEFAKNIAPRGHKIVKVFDVKGVEMWILFSLLLLCLLFVDAKDGGDPHYREMNKQLRDNARVTLLLKDYIIHTSTYKQALLFSTEFQTSNGHGGG